MEATFVNVNGKCWEKKTKGHEGAFAEGGEREGLF